MTALRIGIDVGGTFTDAVALDARSRRLVARVKVPTTHAAAEGVAAGIVEALRRLLQAPGVAAGSISFIAHSTTQATNALLEGDVARVGVVGLLGGIRPLARAQMNVRELKLGTSTLRPAYRYVDARDGGAAARALDELARDGCEAIVASEAFAVDRPRAERTLVEAARARGLLATAGHEVSTLYGLRARTRTAIFNASILPRMVGTSAMTAAAVQLAGIDVPLMIMRSDGGVMDVREVARTPILTMLSGPAAGIAGALLHENVTDGIFIEVGGTSADLSVIRRGLPKLRTARIGAHRTMLRSLDVRTIAIAGGSLLRVHRARTGTAAVAGAGPRSAHIAGLRYAAFTAPGELEGATVEFIEADGAAYLVLSLRDGGRVGLTPTCAANLLGEIPEHAFARGDALSARLAFGTAAAALSCDPEALARTLLDACAVVLRATVDELIDDYALERGNVELVGGGGGAAALVPFLGRTHRFDWRIARDAEVISPIGVALALVRAVVERTIPSPSARDIVMVRREAIERAIAAGAAPELVGATIELDPQRNTVRAIAQGGTAAGSADLEAVEVPPEARAQAAARAMHADPAFIRALGGAGSMHAFEAVGERRPWSPPQRFADACIVDRRGVVRLIAREALLRFISAGEAEQRVGALLEEATSFGDVGRALPALYLAYGERLTGLGALAETAQAVALAREELAGLEPSTPVLAIAIRQSA